MIDARKRRPESFQPGIRERGNAPGDNIVFQPEKRDRNNDCKGREKITSHAASG
jgi:hypothetical protein